MKKQEKPYWSVIFPSILGWFGLIGEKDLLKELTFGHSSPGAAKKALSPSMLEQAQPLNRKLALVRRLQAYAEGTLKDDFLDVKLDFKGLSVFQRRVIEKCREIPFGSTLSYGQLAAKARSPRAYRAVGNCMGGNKIPIIIPCHRVVSSNGGLGSYSAPGGVRMKKRLLSIENPSAENRNSVKKLA
jgi:methylated-DNA-[protein]-cysteine S-methyltransferase